MLRSLKFTNTTTTFIWTHYTSRRSRFQNWNFYAQIDKKLKQIIFYDWKEKLDKTFGNNTNLTLIDIQTCNFKKTFIRFVTNFVIRTKLNPVFLDCLPYLLIKLRIRKHSCNGSYTEEKGLFYSTHMIHNSHLLKKCKTRKILASTRIDNVH